MATSFRLPPEHMNRLEYLAFQLGKSKAFVVKRAIDRLYNEQQNRSTRTMLDCLRQSKFAPLSLDLGDLAGNEERQRQIIRARIAKKNRH